MTILMGINNAIAIQACNAIVDAIDVGGGTAVLRIYDGIRPSDVDTPVGGQTVLSEHNMANPAFNTATDASPGATATANPIADDVSANASGTAAWFRVVDRAGTAVIDGNVGTTDADLILDNVIIAITQLVQINSYTVTVQETGCP